MSRPTARESVALMAGYHSPQIDVDVRLNTNESPEPPPEGFTDAVAARVAEIAWHRYPQRSASELRSSYPNAKIARPVSDERYSGDDDPGAGHI